MPNDRPQRTLVTPMRGQAHTSANKRAAMRLLSQSEASSGHLRDLLDFDVRVDPADADTRDLILCHFADLFVTFAFHSLIQTQINHLTLTLIQLCCKSCLSSLLFLLLRRVSVEVICNKNLHFVKTKRSYSQYGEL